jgi:glycosyltransferase involved in cell wall biosynthesis
MESPLISVLVPCYNDGQWIDEAVESVLQQTYQSFEVIIVDDGSTDSATIRKLEDWAVDRSRIVRTANRGLPAARNLAAQHAKGDLFCALDADDRLAPLWFEKAVSLLNLRPEVAFVTHWLETLGDEHWTWMPECCDLPALLARNTVNGAALVRRSAFEAVGGYDEKMRNGCEDWDFWLRLVEHGLHGVIIPEVLFYYRRRSDSMSRLMTASEAYDRPLRELIKRHEANYRRYLVDVLVAREMERLALRRETYQLEADLLETEISMTRAGEELEAQRRKAERVRTELLSKDEAARLAWETGELRREVAALRASWSWRITAPLRWMYSRISGART